MDQYQTLVVNLEQLTQENMHQLANAGYGITRDPNLVIFIGKVPEQKGSVRRNKI